jgi:nicotinamidase-related amidase
MTGDLDAAELAAPVRTAENTALVLIDFQRDFCEAGGYAHTIDDIGFAREVAPRAWVNWCSTTVTGRRTAAGVVDSLESLLQASP